jgi:hypothetical protein
MQNPQRTFKGVENMLNSSKNLPNKKDVTKVRSQNLVVNDR